MSGRIVQLRGSSGSGKTHLVRRLIAEWGPHLRVRPKDDPTKQKPSYLYWPARGVAVIGHYDVGCGGCDTIKSRSRPFELAERIADSGVVVLMEGLLVSQELHRTVALHERGYEMHDICMHVPLNQALENIHARRAAAGKERKEFRQVEANHKRDVRIHERLVQAGMLNVHWVEGDTTDVGERAFSLVRGLLP